MKLNLFPLFFLLACVTVLPSFQPLAETGIKVTVTNLRSNKGHVLISLFKDGVGYPDKPEKAFKRVKVTIANKNASTLFEGLPAGTYAIAILHDENDDTKMNTNMLGLPKEGYGFSNNVMGAFGPPPYSRASFKFTANSVITSQIKARY